MPGFFGALNVTIDLLEKGKQSNLIAKFINTGKLAVQVCTIAKFEHDKLCYEDSELVIITEGVILNSADLIQTTQTTNLTDALKSLYKENGEVFFSKFRGSFSGLLYDKQQDKLLVYTDHIGDKAIFYTQIDKELYFGSEQKYIAKLLKRNGHTPTLNIAGAYAALTYGYMVADLTYLDTVHRLRGGTYLVYNGLTHSTKIKEYHQFNYQPNYQLSDVQIIEKVDALFTAAVQKQLAKNKEYNYTDFAALSAGLDSRMTTYALAGIKKESFTSFTYSPIGFCDQTASAAIVQQLKNDFLFQSHYSGKLLLNIDNSIAANEGLYMYFGAAVLKEFFDKLNTQPIGLIHSGQIGDVIIGAFSHKKEDIYCTLKNVDMHSKKLGSRFFNLFDFDSYSRMFEDREIYSIYNRGFMGVNSGSTFVFQQFTETMSPFCDIDFCEFCLTIPIEKRINHYIYDKWILTKYPEAAKFKHNGTRIIGGGRWNDVTDIGKRVISKLKKNFHLTDVNAIQSVTPLNVWSNLPQIKKGLGDYFAQHIDLLNNFPELKDDCIGLYQGGSALEKNQVLTLLGTIKLLLS